MQFVLLYKFTRSVWQKAGLRCWRYVVKIKKNTFKGWCELSKRQVPESRKETASSRVYQHTWRYWNPLHLKDKLTELCTLSNQPAAPASLPKQSIKMVHSKAEAEWAPLHSAFIQGLEKKTRSSCYECKCLFFFEEFYLACFHPISAPPGV